MEEIKEIVAQRFLMMEWTYSFVKKIYKLINSAFNFLHVAQIMYETLFHTCIENYVYRENLVTTRALRFHPHTLAETNMAALSWSTGSSGASS